jgi:hypothetical protein
MGTDERNKIISFLDAFADATGRSEEEPIEEVISELEEEGVDYDTSITKLHAIIQQASQEAKRRQLAVAREKRLAMEAKRSAVIEKFADWAKEKLIKRINELISSAEPSVAVSYRDLASKSEADLAALLEDLEFAEEMEESRQSHEK